MDLSGTEFFVAAAKDGRPPRQVTIPIPGGEVLYSFVRVTADGTVCYA